MINISVFRLKADKQIGDDSEKIIIISEKI